ncbi:MAG: pyridoxal-phosphate dependent enzyme [Caldilineaceae bacterium]|nr:pyridoxal-phosphate dependent enzyme [Caldilineaceae bacterium]
MTEGKKTVAFEIWEQLAVSRWQLAGDRPQTADRRPQTAEDTQYPISNTQSPVPNPQSPISNPQSPIPDVVFVSVGDGCIIGGVHKGFKDLLALGWIERMPRIIGVQSSKSAAIAAAWREDREVPLPVDATTRADSISVNAPRDAIKALAAVRETGGVYVLVEDEAILNAIPPLARLGAVFAEPAGATAYAGLLQAYCDGLVNPDETIVVINTGSGLKDVNAAIQATGEPQIIAPTLEAVKEAILN